MGIDRFKDENGNLEVGDEMRDYLKQQTPQNEAQPSYPRFSDTFCEHCGGRIVRYCEGGLWTCDCFPSRR